MEPAPLGLRGREDVTHRSPESDGGGEPRVGEVRLRGVPIELVQPVPDPVLVGLGEHQSETFLADLVPCHYLLIEALQ